MIEIYGLRWASVHGEQADAGSAATWAKGLAGCTPAQVAHGLDACVVSADGWPPTLPEFRAMCLGVPSLAAVKAELLQTGATGQRSPFVVLMLRTIDHFTFRMSDQRTCDRMLAEAYDVARERVMRGEPLPEPEKAIAQEPPRKPVPATREQVQRHLDDVREALHLSPAQAEQMDRDVRGVEA